MTERRRAAQGRRMTIRNLVDRDSCWQYAVGDGKMSKGHAMRPAKAVRTASGSERMMRAKSVAGWGAAVLAAVMVLADAAWAGTGQPSPGQIGMQTAVTPVAHQIHAFHDAVNLTIFAIAGLVLVLMLVVIFKFRESVNPTPSRVSHNTILEVAWTVLPVVILVLIAIPSFKLLRLQYAFPEPDLTIKATGHQWRWTHTYVDKGGFEFDSRMIYDSDLLKAKLGEAEFTKRYPGFSAPDICDASCKGQMYKDAQPLWAERKMPRLLSVDNEVIIPVGKTVHVLVTASDVIHSWAVPSFGIKTDAVPGRVSATWFRAEQEGIFYGQCSELCGKDHAFMPIAIRVVKADIFDNWSGLMSQAKAETDRAKRRELQERARKLIQAVALEQSGQTLNLASAAH
jgi:cytochrome c oxidase subunit 2